MRSIKELKNIKGKKVIVRVDFNVPIQNGKVEDDFRIRKALPTIEYLLKKGAKPILITHLGEGREDLGPVIKRFFQISKIPKDKVEIYENIRKFKGEEENDEKFAKHLAMLGDIYVNDAFPVSHREHASVVSVPKYLPHYAGFQLEEEVRNLSKVVKNPKHPFLFILGGAKISTKLPLIKRYLRLADYVFIGGAVLNDILESKGLEVGKSLTDKTVSLPPSILKNKKLLLPVDVLVKGSRGIVNKKISEVGKNEVIIDIGTQSIKMLLPYIKKSKLILWNGPLGKYENRGEGDKATRAILKAVASAKAETILGGGDTVELVDEMKLSKKISFVSTGGGATLDFLTHGTLPGIKALD